MQSVSWNFISCFEKGELNESEITMAPYKHAVKDRFDELFIIVTKLEKELEINEDLQEFIKKQWDRDSDELTIFPMCYKLHHPDTPEYRQFQKKEKKLKDSCEYAERRVMELKDENIRLKYQINKFSEEVRQLRF